MYTARAEAGDGAVAGMDLGPLTTYVAVGYIARSAYFNNVDSEIANRFSTGEVTIDLLRPINVHGYWLAQAAGETLFRIVFFALPMAVVVVPMFDVAPPSGDGWWQFPLLFIIAFMINGELNFSAGVMAFWLESTWGLMSLKRNALMLCSGLMVPLHFLSGLIGETAVLLLTCAPFAWIGYYPTMAYIGQLPQAGWVLVGGCAWMVVLRVFNIWLWRRAAQRLEVQGG